MDSLLESTNLVMKVVASFYLLVKNVHVIKQDTCVSVCVCVHILSLRHTLNSPFISCSEISPNLESLIRNGHLI